MLACKQSVCFSSHDRRGHKGAMTRFCGCRPVLVALNFLMLACSERAAPVNTEAGPADGPVTSLPHISTSHPVSNQLQARVEVNRPLLATEFIDTCVDSSKLASSNINSTRRIYFLLFICFCLFIFTLKCQIQNIFNLSCHRLCKPGLEQRCRACVVRSASPVSDSIWGR